MPGSTPLFESDEGRYVPRRARIVISNYPHHIVQRGHDKQAVFRGDGDRYCYTNDLRTGKIRFGCRIYAYCLMNNHVHLVVNPGEETESLGKLMKWVSGNHAMRVNHTSGRRGALWEGRYHSSIIATDRYLLACCRYVELNPVRAGIVDRPGKFRWSSYRRRAGLEWNEWLDRDPAYMALGGNTEMRQRRYREWMRQSVSEDGNSLMRESLRRGHVTGTRGCVEKIYELTGSWLGPKRRGRPPQEEMGTVPN